MSESQEPGTRRRAARRRPPSLFWPLVLVSAGVLLLLSNLGYVPWSSWNLLWRFWPLLLIALGIEVLIGRRSMLGAIVSGLLILLLIGGAVALVFLAPTIPALSDYIQPAQWEIEQVEYPLDGVESAVVSIDWSSLPGSLSALSDSRNLIEGDIVYRGELIFDAHTRDERASIELGTRFTGPWFGPWSFEDDEERWDVKLSPDVALDLELDVGSGSCSFDLTDLRIGALLLDAGSGDIDLTLPARSSFDARLDGGSGSLDIGLPPGVGARVVLEAGSGSFSPGPRFRLLEGERRGDGVWETENFETVDYTVVLDIEQGSGSIDIVTR